MPRIAGEYQELGERHGIDSPSEGPTLTHLEIGLLASRTEKVPIVLSHPGCGNFFTAALGN